MKWAVILPMILNFKNIMLDIFNRNSSQKSIPNWVSELHEIQNRWFVFLEKLEQKIEELGNEGVKALQEIELQDYEDQTFYKVKSGIFGQLNNIREKAYNTKEEKIMSAVSFYRDKVSVLDENRKYFDDFYIACSDRYNKQFEEKLNFWSNKLKNVNNRNYEKEYAEILANYEEIKNSFYCKQCNSPIFIDRIYTISTYLKCPSCQIQNTYEPGSKARSLENIGRALAEQRTKHLLEDAENESQRERDLYHQIHKLKLSLIFEKNKNIITKIEKIILEKEKQRQESILQAPLKFYQYQRAMFDEWNKILPEHKEAHEKFFESWILR